MNITDFLKRKNQNLPVIHGVVPGLVVDTADPDELGRVQILVPRISLEFTTNWARVATPMAGNQSGAYFRPEIGDEVLVAFDSGNVNLPYVVGSLWNGRMMPPAGLGAHDPHIIEIRSRAVELPVSPLGLFGPAALAAEMAETTAVVAAEETISAADETESEDLEPSEAAVEESEATGATDEAAAEAENVAQDTGSLGHYIRLNNRTEDSRIEIVDESGENSITINALTNTISIKSAMNIEFNAPQGNIVMTGQNVVINAVEEVNLNSNATINLSSSDINATALAAINGTAGGEISMNAGLALNAEAGAEMGLTAGAAMTLEAGLAMELNAGGSLTAMSEVDVNIVSNSALVSITAVADVSIMGAIINLNL